MRSTLIKYDSKDDGVLDVAIAIFSLVTLLLFSSYVLELTSVSNRYQIALSEALRNVSRTLQQSSSAMASSQAISIAKTTFSTLGLNGDSLSAQIEVSNPTCLSETVSLSVANPILPALRITSSSTQDIGFNQQC